MINTITSSRKPTRLSPMAELAQRSQTENAILDLGGLGASNNRFNQAKISGMNKYDAATLWLAPGAYKPGSILPFLPKTGLSVPFLRNSAAWRRNAAGKWVQEAIDVPLVDYPTSATPAVLLFEPSYVMSILQTGTIGSWSIGSALNRTVKNVGDLPGTRLVAVSASDIGAGAGLGRISSPLSPFELTSGVYYTLSFIFEKTGSHTQCGYYFLASQDLGSWFDVSDLTSGVIYAGSDYGNRIRKVTPLGNDLFLCEETFQMNANRTAEFVYFAPTNKDSTLSVGNEGAFYAPVIEPNRFATTRVLTGVSAMTRAVSQLPLNDLQDDVFAANEGCFLLDLHRMVTNNAGEAVLTLRLANNTEVVRFVANGVANQYLVNLPTLSASTAYNAGKKIAVAWNGTNVRISQGGTIVATINGALGAIDQLRYTGNGVLEANEILGYITAPTNAELNALTA